MPASLRPERRTRAEVEEFLLREFLEHLGIVAAEVQKRERPDFQACWPDEAGAHAIGIEITEYQVDQVPPHGSLARRILEIEERVIEIAQPLCIAAVPGFLRLEVCLALNRSAPPKKRDIAAVAQQLAAYLTGKKEQIGVEPRSLGLTRDDAASFPLVCRHFKSIRAHLGQSQPGLWYHGGAAHVGLVEERVVDRLDQKRERRKGFDLAGLDECWLVICASGTTPHDRAGPPEHCRQHLCSPEVRAAASAAGFDRVYFWERVRTWHEVLFP